METSPFIQEKYLPGFVSSSHNQDWLDLCQELLHSPKPGAPAECWAVWQTLATAPIVQISAATSFTCRWCSPFIRFQLPKELAAEDIPWPGEPWQQWQWRHVLDVSAPSCSTAQSNGNQAEWAEAVWILEVGNAGHLGLARRQSGFQDSKLFVLIKFWMWEINQLPEIISVPELQSLRAFLPNNEKISADVKEIRRWNCLGLIFLPIIVITISW